jgi:hypothetical protein
VEEMSRGIPRLGGISVAFRGTGDTERPRYFSVGKSKYEIMETSFSVTTVLMVGAELEQLEIAVDNFF